MFLITQALQFMDKTALNYANLFGYKKALGLKGQQFNYLSASESRRFIMQQLRLTWYQWYMRDTFSVNILVVGSSVDSQPKECLELVVYFGVSWF